ncbi:MAG: DNA-binding protein [Candidatus Bathyarchaeia archaeon]
MKTYEGRLGGVFISKLDYGSDMLESIKSLAKEKGVKSGVFFAIGAVSRARFSYYDQSERRYVEVEVDEPLEVLSCMGNIAYLGDEMIVHGHVTFGRKNGEALGGHLVNGVQVFSGEVLMMKVEGFNLTRAYDQLTGLNQIV